MSSDLLGKTAIVTGGGRDIGRAIAVALAEAGAAVVVNYHESADAANAVVAEIARAGGRAEAVQADVTKSADVDRLIAAAVELSAGGGGDGAIDILVNNAGGLVARRKITEMDEAFWDRVIALNLTSVFLVTRAALAHFRDGGAIVNLSSLAARDGGGPGSVAYAASKGAVLTMTRALAKELAPRRIRVNAVSPGLIATRFHDVHNTPAGRAATVARTQLGREGTAAEVASAVVFLASDASSYITGESIEINGGLYFV